MMANGADPVGFGLVQSLSRPGGNSPDSKQIDVIRELLPGIVRWMH